MAWIYLAESEDSLEPWQVTCGQSPIVKTTDMLSGYSSLEWHLEICPKLRSGMMCEPCPPVWLEHQWKSSMEVFHAKTLAMQAAEKAWKESEADYFSRSFDSLARFDHDSYSWKTCQRSLIGDWEPLPPNLPNCGMTVDGEFYPLEMWERTIEETDGGLWPTPVASEGGEGIDPTKRGKKLHIEVQKFPTPRANDSQKRGEFDILNPRNGLPAAAKRWPTPKAHETMNWNMGGNLTLTGAAKNFLPTPRAFMHKDSHHDRGKGNLGEVIGGQLNPTWVEWLMGYPCEWSVLRDSVMRWFRSVQEKPLKD